MASDAFPTFVVCGIQFQKIYRIILYLRADVAAVPIVVVAATRDVTVHIFYTAPALIDIFAIFSSIAP